MSRVPDVSGSAALAICESLILALSDRKILSEREVVGVLMDAAAAHADHPSGDGLEVHHRAVAALIDSILAGGNSVRRH